MLEKIKAFLLNDRRNGKLISTEYVGSKEKLIWECSNGHQWKATWDNVKHGTWCPFCAKTKKPTMEYLQKRALARNGKLISTEYVGSKEKLIWECSNGHQWKACWNSIDHMNSWCPTCAKLNKPDIEILKTYACNKQGKLLTKIYKNNRTKMLWECGNGHQWEATAHAVVYQNHWCIYCALFKSENQCRNLLNRIFSGNFLKHRIKYQNCILEFDGYDKDLNIAFEYQGYQHYIYPNIFHKTKNAFIAQQHRDKVKKEYCKNNNISLIEIPYNCGNIETFITNIHESYL